MISGSRMYGRKAKVITWGYCEYCDNYSKQMSYNGRKWTHINYIPIFPEGPRMHVIKECKKCSVGLHLKLTDFQELIESIEDSAEKAIEVLHNGEEYYIIEEDGEETTQSCVDTLVGAVEILHCTGCDEAVQELLTAIDTENYRKIHCAIKGKFRELQGNLKEAIVLFERAVKNFPDDEHAYYMLASALYNSGKIRESREVYENLLKITSSKTNVMLMLLDVYNELKEYVTMAETFEHCFEAHPEFAKQKKFVKRYRKACKKAGTRPKEVLINIQ